MNYLLDTCVVSDFVKGFPRTLDIIKNTSPSEIAISSITLMELEYGIFNSFERTRKIESILRDFLSKITIIDFTAIEAKKAAYIRSVMKQRGTPIGFYDFLIAATALTYDITLVTSNICEFERIENLKIANWR